MGMLDSIKFSKVLARRGRMTTALPAVSYKRSEKKITLRISADDDVFKKAGIKHDSRVNLYVGEGQYLMIDLDENEGQFKVRGNKPPVTVLTIETTAVDAIPSTCLPEAAEWKDLRVVEHEYVHVIVATDAAKTAKNAHDSSSAAGVKAPVKNTRKNHTDATAKSSAFAEVNKPRRGRPRKNP